MTIKNPDGKSITFEVIDFDKRKHLLNTQVVKLYKIDRNFMFDNEIHQLKNGDYLFLYTSDAYAFRFTSQEELDLFVNNKDYFTCSLHIDNQTSKFHYMFNLHNDKSLEKKKNIVSEIDGYPNKSPMLNFKLYLLNDGTYLRGNQRSSNIFEARWFPDLETFEWYYSNKFTD